MCSQNELKIIVDAIRDSYRDIYGDDIVKILMYGSYARGDHQEDSDVDIVAIVRGSRAALQEKLSTVWDVSADLELQYETIISPTVIPYEEFQQYREVLPYYRNIDREGIEIGA